MWFQAVLQLIHQRDARNKRLSLNGECEESSTSETNEASGNTVALRKTQGAASDVELTRIDSNVQWDVELCTVVHAPVSGSDRGRFEIPKISGLGGLPRQAMSLGQGSADCLGIAGHPG